MTPSDESITGTCTIKFQTKISDDKLNVGIVQPITNTANIKNKDGTITKDATAQTQAIKMNWITKSGKPIEPNDQNGAYDPTKRQIEWTIEANKEGVSLSKAVITDVLPTGLKWELAKLQTWNGTTFEDSALKFTAEPTYSKYELGDISTMVHLVIIASVTDTTSPDKVTNFQNTATLSWEGLGVGIGSNNVTIGIGFNPIAKSATRYDSSTHEVNWSVTVDTKKLIYGGNLRVLDLLVYGESDFTSTSFDTISDNEDKGLFDVTKDDIAKLTPQYNQKYTANSFASKDLKVAVHTLTKNGKAVADLLVVTGSDSGAAIDPATAHTFTYKSTVTNPTIYAQNTNNTNPIIKNTAHLFNGTNGEVLLSSATANQTVKSHMIEKDVLSRDAAAAFDTAPTDRDKANGTTGSDKNAFDYADKSVVYRIHVNSNGLKNATNDITTVDGEKLGKLTVTDQLPEGWEFKEFSKDHYFELFSGTKSGSDYKKVTASAHVSDTSGILNGGTPIKAVSPNGETMKFTFEKLEKPYVILVKAGPTAEKAKEMFSKNETYTLKNSAALSSAKFTSLADDFEKITVTSTVLSKGNDATKAETDGYITWKVEYKPSNILDKEAYIEDTLPVGIDLRTNSKGEPIYGNNMIINELTLNSDGSYAVGSSVALPNAKIITYTNRTIKFNIPDSKKAYRLTYVTDITGEVGSEIENIAKLTMDGVPISTGGNENKYTVSENSCTASLTRSGYIKINKTGENDVALSGATFTLCEKSTPNVVFRTGKTATYQSKDGVLFLRTVPEGNYILKETASPTDYDYNARTYAVTVAKGTNGKFTTEVDGVVLGDDKTITIKNYKSGTTGNLEISKKLIGNAYTGHETDKFEFTVTFSNTNDSYSYVGNGVPDGSIKSGDKISLAHGQSINITLPKDITYEVTETENADFVANATKLTEKIKVNKTAKAEFTNRRDKSLVISKTLEGKDADATKDFEFKINFSQGNQVDTNEYNFIRNDKTTGKIKDGNTFKLKGSESIEVYNLPDSTKYTITETDYSADKYTASITTTTVGTSEAVVGKTATGTTELNKTVTVNFINTQKQVLSIGKSVTGKDGERGRKFKFKVEFSDKVNEYPYIGTNVDFSPDLTIKSGDTIELQDTQSAIIYNLPVDTSYTITEETADGYTTTCVIDKKQTANGNIATGKTTNQQITAVVFTNYRSIYVPAPRPTPRPEPEPEPETEVKPEQPVVEQPVVEPPVVEPPKFMKGKVPDPNSPDSPQVIILIDENGIPLGRYEKHQMPDKTFVYMDEDGVPLGRTKNPQMGNNMPVGALALLMTASFLGAGALAIYRKKLDKLDEEE